MTEVGDHGQPWTYFLLDPVLQIDAQLMGISKQGITPIFDPTTGQHNLFDHVGSQHYPWPADYIEEGIRFGFSTLFPRKKELLSLVGPGSRLIKLHEKAGLLNPGEFYADRARPFCTQQDEIVHDLHLHADDQQLYTCAGLHWEVMHTNKHTTAGKGRAVTRKMPAFEYTAWTPPTDITPDHFYGAFVWLPITHWEVVLDDSPEKSHQLALDLLGDANGLDVITVEE